MQKFILSNPFCAQNCHPTMRLNQPAIYTQTQHKKKTWCFHTSPRPQYSRLVAATCVNFLCLSVCLFVCLLDFFHFFLTIYLPFFCRDAFLDASIRKPHQHNCWFVLKACRHFHGMFTSIRCFPARPCLADLWDKPQTVYASSSIEGTERPWQSNGSLWSDMSSTWEYFQSKELVAWIQTSMLRRAKTEATIYQHPP